MNILRSLIVLSLVFAVSGSAMGAGDAVKSPKTVRLLTVGNSFSGNAVRYLPQIVEAAGHKLILARADLGGCPMDRHWRHVEAAEADPASADARPYTVKVDDKNKQFSLKEMLTSEKWDFVTIQQASMISSDIKTYRPYAKNLRDYIKKHAPQAEVLMHQTWAYRVDDPRFDDPAKDSQEKMYKDLRAAYRTIAKELGLRILPVGDALYAADTDPNWGYRPAKFDKAALKHPDLPDQTHSLHVGYMWRKDGATGSYTLGMDGHHAGIMGCYLAGCIWFEMLYNESVVDNKYVPREIRAAEARYLRALAHRIVADK